MLTFAAAALLAAGASAATFVVNNVGDTVDAALGDGVCDAGGGVCTLRAAIGEANAFAGADTINFTILPAGPKTITLTAALPGITSVVSIDGTTQPGFVALPPYAPVVEISAALCGAAVLDLAGGSSGSTIRGLVINRCPFVAIRIRGSSNNVIAGNFLGTNLAGTAAGPGNQVSVYIGLSNFVTSSNNRVGGTTAADRNLISGNTSDGIQINAGTVAVTNNVIEGNYIGVDVNGASPIPNTNQGIAIFGANAQTNTRIGGTAAGAANLISGNGNDGVLIANAGTTGTRVEGNRIGTNAGGTLAIPNLRGVEITASATGNTIGGTSNAAGNQISGNTIGVLINGANANSVLRNGIGVEATGTAPLPNTQHGVQILAGSSSNLIGDASGNGNLISGNTLNGVDILASNANHVSGNTIGLDVTGSADVGNLQFGVAIAQGASGNVVGEVGGRNVISGNDMAGVRIVDIGTNNNLVQLNYIGLDATGTLEKHNNTQGVILDSGSGAASGNTIGGVGLGNVISGNLGAGIQVRQQMTGTVITGNRIGTNAAGTAAVPNGSHGVQLAAGTTNNTIGSVASPNLISGNAGQGVRIDGAGTDGNVVAANFIGTDVAGTGAVANTGGGVAITNAAANNTIGGLAANAGNRIAFNASYGINVAAAAGNGNGILGNGIYGNVAELGIDLAHEPGVTPNDLGDVPFGAANDLQNFPVLSAASTNTTDHIHIAGSLNSTASTTFRIEFFATSALVGADASGFGEGERYLGATSVTTDVNGNAVIGVSLAPPMPVAAGETVTATATDPTNNTSEFSAAILAYASAIVTTTADTVDGSVTSVSALITNPGADNRISLREAIQATNATLGTDTIRFGIPLTDSGHRYYNNDSIANSLTTTQVATLADAASPSSVAISDLDPDYPTGLTRSWYRIRPTSALDTITQGVVLDATTQPGAVPGGPVIVIDGSLAGASANGLELSAGPGTVRGLVINGFTSNGLSVRGSGGFTITGNYLGTDASGTKGAGNGASGLFLTNLTGATPCQVGGSSAALRNVISGNGVGASSNKNGIYVYNYFPPVNTAQVKIQGNYIGTDVTGTAGLGTQERGVVLEYTGGHLIGGSGLGEGNLISGNAGAGIDLNGNMDTGGGGGAPDDNNVIEGNKIGTNVAGTGAIPNAGPAIQMYGTIDVNSSASGNTVRGNVLAASTTANAHGIAVWGNADNNLFEGNYIGTDAAGVVDLGNAGSGIHFEVVGGFVPTGNIVRSNVIRFNDTDGVRVLGTGAVATLTQNQIFTNDNLGIDLGGDGPTLNDTGDIDMGPNGLLNFPSLPPAVETTPGTLSVTYGLDLVAGFYRIEFFKSPSGPDPSHFGEGEVFNSAIVVNHPGGKVVYGTSLAGNVGDVISATTTVCSDGAPCTTLGSTSEFSGAWPAVTTAVKLMSFTATAGDASVRLDWRTASELDNLGFHLYRSPSADGPWLRLTESLIPGLGSSPLGASYSWTDAGLSNGTRYYYRLEDVDRHSVATFHGPVSAVPAASSDDGSGDEDTGDASPGAAGTESYGDPSGVSLRVLSRTSRRALIELRTPGFYARRDADGRVRVVVPGFDLPEAPEAAALPLRRVLLDGEVGVGARLGRVVAEDRVAFPGLAPAAVGYPEIQLRPDGTVRPGRRAAGLRARRRAHRQEDLARLVGAAFLGEEKKVVLELLPLDYDADRLIMWRRLQVEVLFTGREPSERGSGHRGRRQPPPQAGAEQTLAFLHTKSAGLHAVAFESLGLGSRPLQVSRLGLLRQGEPVPFHLEPPRASFGPGGVLYFHADREAASTAFAGEVAYELVSGIAGTQMLTASAAPLGAPIVSPSRDVRRFETNRIYQPALLEAADPWLWIAVPGGTRRNVAFSLDGLVSLAPGRVTLRLQGASDAAGVDHHVAFLVNGVPIGETRFDGMSPHQVELELPASVLKQGDNALSLENVGDTGVSSLVFLDRFEVSFPQSPALRAGRFAGSWSETGVATLAGAASAVALDVSDPGSPVWLTAFVVRAGTARIGVAAGRQYLVASPRGLLTPRVAPAVRSSLRDSASQADYVVIAPAELLAAAAPLVERRQSQGLSARSVSLEEIAAVFGHGESSAEAIRSFLSYAFQSWAEPTLRFVLLLGDASYDPRNFTGTALPAPLPALWTKTSYLWTASDPTLAAVNGDDLFPDMALGRLPAKTPDEARALVAKVLDWEDSGQGTGGTAILVADNPDPAGDFEQDIDDIRASFLADRPTTTIKLSELGSLTRPAILEALDRGASTVSYVGHGGAAVWASENVLNSWDPASLAAQSRQPLMLTMNCLNGYFVGPSYDSLAEAFLTVPGRGTIAAFSPSGLSLDAPAHVLHRALMAEITSGRHRRLGDAVLAAQQAYAETGLMPELLSVYHLFGDPALLIR